MGQSEYGMRAPLVFSLALVHIVRMTARERWTSDIRCAECGRSATAVISEEDHPYETGCAGKMVEACPSGFEVIPDKDDSKGMRIVCSRCKTVVYGPK